MSFFNIKERSLVFKQTLLIFVAVMTVFALVIVIVTANILRSTAADMERLTVDNTRLAAAELDHVFREVERGVRSMAILAATQDADDKLLKSVLLQTIKELHEDFPQVYGGSFAFAPYQHDVKQKYVMWYASVKNNVLTLEDAGSEDYQYEKLSWFLIPEYWREVIWSEPIYDHGLGNVLVSTCSVPIILTREGKEVFVGVATVDISLEWLQHKVDELQEEGDGYSFLLSRFGQFVSHPRRKWLSSEKIYSADTVSRLQELHNQVLNNASGVIHYQDKDFEPDKLFCHAILKSNKWRLVMAVPTDDLWLVMSAIKWQILWSSLVGVSIILLLVIIVTRRGLRPLRKLNEAAKHIGEGNFNSELPSWNSRDEIGELSRSFELMQHHLTEYIDKLRLSLEERSKAESELRIAQQIQEWILPLLSKDFAHNKNFDLSACLIPARGVGGDLYDFFWISPQHLALVIGDVSGKGVPAAIFMAVTQTLHRAISNTVHECSALVDLMSQTLEKNNDMMMFVTYFFGVLNVETGEIEYTNAGHNAPLVLHGDGQIAPLDGRHGPPLAIGGMNYRSGKINLALGETIFLYTDGVTEALDQTEQEFGTARLQEVLKKNSGNAPEELINAVNDALNIFASGTEQADDITMLVLRRVK